MTFQQFPHTNVWGHKFDLAVKRLKVHLQSANLVDPESSRLYTKIQPQSFLGSGEEDFKVFLPYMGIAAILFNCEEPFKQIGNTILTECPM